MGGGRATAGAYALLWLAATCATLHTLTLGPATFQLQMMIKDSESSVMPMAMEGMRWYAEVLYLLGAVLTLTAMAGHLATWCCYGGCHDDTGINHRVLVATLLYIVGHSLGLFG